MMSLNDGTFRALFVVTMLGSAWYYVFLRNRCDLRHSIAAKNVLISGASQGIGEQLAYHCAKMKANLVLTSNSRQKLVRVAENCHKLGAPKVEVVVADMTEPKDREELSSAVKKHFNDELHFLLLSHALFPMSYWNGTSENLTFLQQSLQANFLSYIETASRSLPSLRRGNGHIGVVSSGCGPIGCAKLAHYSAAKMALHGFFSSWRQELLSTNIPVSITLCILGSTSRDVAATYEQDLKALLLPENVGVSPEDVAPAILENVVQRNYDMYHPKTLLLTVILKHLFPKQIEDFLGKIGY